MSFQEAYKYTSTFEGGYIHDPHDRGGETFRGISRLNWPTWPGWPLIDSAKSKVGNNRTAIDAYFKNGHLIDEFTLEFYKVKFWSPFDHREINQKLKAKLFDTAVNCGIRTTVKFLQRSLNKMNGELVVDGILGVRTLAAVKNSGDTEQLLNTLCHEQLNYYRRIVERNPSQQRFLKGWERRAAWKPE